MASSPPPPPPPQAGSPQPSSPMPAVTGVTAPDEDQPATPLDEEPESPDLPLTMTASTMLMALPCDATAALAAVPSFPKAKVLLRFKPVGSAPAFQIKGGMQVNVTSTQKFEFVVRWLRRQLRLREDEHVFLYINSTFAPSLEEVIGNLWMCFKDSSNQLNVSYSLTPAFG